jgi:uncharacterized membrane protein
MRSVRHLLYPRWRTRRRFPDSLLKSIERAIAASERSHLGEIRFAVEGALDLTALLRGQTARERAVELFSLQHVWDTEENNGVLIYVLLADHAVEIVADRGIARHVDDAQWRAICEEMERAFRDGRYEQAALIGIERIGRLLAQYFPADGSPNLNELPDNPLVR